MIDAKALVPCPECGHPKWKHRGCPCTGINRIDHGDDFILVLCGCTAPSDLDDNKLSKA